MAKKGGEQPDMKEIEKRAKDAKKVAKELEQCKKELASAAAKVKELREKVG
jgi:hypothetical protein